MKTNIIPIFSYLDTIASHMLHHQPFPIKDIHMVAGRKSGKTYNTILAMIKIALLIPNTTMYMMRQAKSDVRFLFDELVNILNHHGNEVIWKTHYRAVVFPNNSRIICLGLKSQNSSKISLQGLGGVSGQYTIIFLEERHEFADKDLDAITQAVRGFKYSLFISACNPWSKKHRYIEWCSDQVDFNVDKLKSYGYILAIKDNALFHYGNHLTNPNLSDDDRESLLKTINPVHQPVVLWGIPGIEVGGIYQSHLQKIRTRLDRTPTRFRFGVDFGEINDATACTFLGFDSSKSWVAYLGEYYWQNTPKKLNKDSMELARDVCHFILDRISEWPLAQRSRVEVYVDKSASSFKSEMTNILRGIGHNYNIILLTASCPPIKRRIDTFLKLMAWNNFYIIKCPMLFRDLDFSEWVMPDTQSRSDNPKRNDKEDHALNSAEYCIASDLSQWGKKLR